MKRLQLRTIMLTIFCLLLVGCSDKKFTNVIKQWQGKEICMPGSLHFKSFGRDTTCNLLLSEPFRVLTYVDPETCTSCQLGLTQWKGFIDLCEQLQLDVGFLFVINSTDYPEFEYNLKMYDFSYPVIYDANDDFNKLNSFPKEQVLRTFLLDAENRVVIIGSPFKNRSIMNLYINTIKQIYPQTNSTVHSDD